MFRHYIIIAWRNLKKNKIYSAINISGLSIGLAACWLIVLFVSDEWSYDSFYPKGDRIYRVVQHASWPGNQMDLAPTSAPFAPALEKDYPEVEKAVRLVPEGGGLLVYEGKKLQEDAIFFADAAVPEVFDYKFTEGDPATALAQPQSMVVTESLAKRLFGTSSNVVGKTIMMEGNYPNKVTGVMKDIPGNSHLQLNALRSLSASFDGGWQQFNLYTYVLLAPNASAKGLESKLSGFYHRHLEKEMGQLDYHMELQPIASIHLHSALAYEISNNGNSRNVYLFLVIALLILVIAAINYMNLSTARSVLRVREIGVRKTIGSGKEQLIGLFLGESVLFTLLAAGIALYLTSIALPYFNDFTGKHLTLWQYGVLPTIGGLVFFSLLTGILAGIYPAFFMSRFNVIRSLKGELGNQTGTVLFRKGLVTFQFVVTIVLIATSLLTWNQMNYLSHKDLGFNKDQVLSFHLSDRDMRDKVASIKQQLLSNASIEAVAAASNPIGNNNIGSNGYNFEVDGHISETSKMAQDFMVDEDFLPTMEIKLLQGRNFSPDMPSDRYNSVLVNETLVKQLGWKEPVGKRVRFKIDQAGTEAESTVIGVVKDFNIYSLQHEVEPLVLHMPAMKSMEDNLYVRVKPGNTTAALDYIQGIYRQFDQLHPLEWEFLDQNFARQYEAEQKQSSLFLVFTILSVIIACLGLLGLAAFMARQRAKEIGIRRVLGASVTGITAMISGEFLKLVVVAVLLAFPLAWWAMHSWLQGFAYRVTIHWWFFALAGLLALIVALFTVCFQALRAAITNPVKNLRSE